MTGRLPFVLAILVAADITGLAGQTGSVPTGAISGVVVDASSDQPWFPDARIELVRLGSISGMVVGEAAEPVVGVFVRVLSLISIGGRQQWTMGDPVRTDDQGIPTGRRRPFWTRWWPLAREST